jgi:predicted small secreted protein
MLKSTRFSLASVLLSSLALSACAAPQVGEPVELTGKLVLRGPAEFSTPAVVTKDAGAWALEGLASSEVAKRQNSQVRVHGTITKVRESAVVVPSVRVDSIETLKAD